MDDQLRALVAIVDEGSFDAAAYALGVSPSAVSQRIKALERRTGRVVVRRSSPCTPTDTGAVLLRMARQVQLVEAEAMASLGGAGEGSRDPVDVVVNADSLATWFVPVLREAVSWPDITLRLHVEDQDHSARLLRDGTALAAVTGDAEPVVGCSLEPLGAMRYRPVAAPSLHERYRSGRGVDWAAMPVVRFNAKDGLQHGLLQSKGVDPAGVPVHVVPSSHGFLAAVRAGLGWGMVPEAQLAEVPRGELVPLLAREHVDVQLHWQCWRLESRRLERLTQAVRTAAAALR